MTCAELERLFVSGASEEAAREHLAGCSACSSARADLEKTEAIVSALRPPAASPALMARLASIPARTVSCEGADRLAAEALEGEISPADLERLAFHRSRCQGCAEAAAVLEGARNLAAPAPAPWLLGRLAASRPEKRKSSFWALLASPKGAIGIAYFAAVVVMFSGFNPADLARKAGVARLEERALVSAQVAERSLGDRLGAFEEDVVRKLASWKGHAVGYGRAAVTRAIQLVMKTEPEPTPRRGKTGEEKGLLRKNETGTGTWRA